MKCVKKTNLLINLTFYFVILAITGCTTTSTQLVRSWQEPAFDEKPLKEILVLGAFKKEKNRAIYEDGVAEAVKKVNHSAIASHTIEPDLANLSTKDGIIALVKKTNADAVMITTLLNADRKKFHTPPDSSYVPVMGYGRKMNDYYNESQAAANPDIYVATTMISLEITVFSVKTEKMIWAGATQSLNPGSKEQLVAEAASLIIKDMKKAGLL